MWTFDVASMHPSSVIAEVLFGPEFTRRFYEIKEARVAIKHKDFDKAKNMLDGKLVKYLNDGSLAKQLAQALKIAINSVYGLTAAKFENAFRDIRNVDNIVAKRGALFMIDLKEIVEKAGGTVVHIKTDSIKVVNPSQDIIDLIMNTGKKYGYDFEIEHIFEKFCLVNNAVYIAKLSKADPDDPGKWTATGPQFAVPYVFKKLFSKEPIEFADMCETKSVSKGDLYLDMNEELGEDEHNYIFVGRVGSFCPIKPGCNGGKLYRYNDGKYYAATGTTGFRWLEAELVKTLGKEEDIDRSYYDILADEAINTIKQFGDYEWFVSDDSNHTMIDLSKNNEFCSYEAINSDPLPEGFGSWVDEHGK